MTWTEQYVAFKTILVKEILRFARIWIQTILPPVISTALYFLIFGRLIGTQVADMHGQPYIHYIVPGVILMAVITNAYANVVSSFYGAKFQRNIEELLVSPVPNQLILVGFVAGGLARGLAVGMAVTLVSLVFADFHVSHVTVALSMAALTAVLFALGGLINGIYAKSFDDISIIPTFVLTPLTYLGGVFYSIDLLPEPWRTFSLVNPILYMINAFRYGLLGVSDLPLWTSYAITLGLIAALYFYALHLLAKGQGLRA